MAIRSIEELKRHLNYSTLVIFFIVFFSAFVGLYLAHDKFMRQRNARDREKIVFHERLYQANLSEKLGIIASSTVFIDYLRSGVKTRKRLDTPFLTQLSSLRSKSISGMELLDANHNLLFTRGEPSPDFVSLKLCYLNQTLDPVMGDCAFIWKLYFRYQDLLRQVSAESSSLVPCENCQGYSFFKDAFFGAFPIEANSALKVKLAPVHDKDYFFYLNLILMALTLVLFGSWSWYRLSRLLNHHIADPIQKLAFGLKSNETLEPVSELEELQMLRNEINSWKEQTQRLKNAEQNEKLAVIAAQLAHDVRSPL